MTDSTTAMAKVHMQAAPPRLFWWPLFAGVFAPILCFWFDPAVIHRGDVGFGPYVGPWLRVCVVTLFLFTALAIGFALIPGIPGRCRAVLAGALGASVLGAAALQLILLPLVVMGTLAMGIGLLGLCPSLTVHACWRLRGQLLRTEPRPARSGAWLGLVIGLAVPTAVAVAVTARAPVALRAMFTAPTDALRRELVLYQRLFELYDVANWIEATLDRDQAIAFGHLRTALGIPEPYDND